MSAAGQLKPVFTTGIQHKLHRLLRFGEMALSGAQIGDNARTNYLQTPVVIASLIIATALVALRILKILYQPAPAGRIALLTLKQLIRQPIPKLSRQQMSQRSVATSSIFEPTQHFGPKAWTRF
ncbi:hypothetical protein WJX82_004942 [Trebouxia sp. C0006]